MKLREGNQWTTGKWSVEKRFWSMALLGDGCWPWQGAKVHTGHGLFWVDGRYIGAHRWAWEWFYGQKIPEGKYIGHRCHNGWCVRPDHIRPITPKENQNEGGAQGAKTHCLRGHEFTEENTYRFINAKGYLGRACKTCRRLRRQNG